MATITKILETTIAAGGTTATFTDAEIPNSLLRIHSTNPNIYPMLQTLSGNTVTVTYEEQETELGVALEIVKSGLVVYNGLDSTSTDDALSAAQGKALSDSINTLEGVVEGLVIPSDLSDLDDVDIDEPSDGQLLKWDGVNQKWVNFTSSSVSLPVIDFTSDLIYDSGNITSNYSTFSKTVDSDCWALFTVIGGGSGSTAVIYINGGPGVCGNDNTKNIAFTPFYVKTGDVITVRNVTNASYRIRLYPSR